MTEKINFKNSICVDVLMLYSDWQTLEKILKITWTSFFFENY